MTAQTTEKLRQLQGSMAGLPIWIAGAGPTLGDVNLGGLRREYILALNSAVQFFSHAKDFRNSWWLWWDQRTYRECIDKLKDWHCLRAIVHKQGLETLRNIKRQSRLVEYAKEPFKPSRTVLETALLISKFLGASEVYLVGIDGLQARDGVPYAEGLEWKPCYFMDKENPSKESKSAEDFSKAMDALLPRLDGMPVYQTSELYAGEQFEKISFDEALDRSRATREAEAAKPKRPRDRFR